MVKDNAVTTVLTDAEKIAEELVPSVAAVPRVVGVLIKQVEKLSQTAIGKDIEALAEEALGLTPAAPATEGTDPTVAAKLAELQREIDALKGVPAAPTEAELQAQLDALKAAKAAGGAA